MNFIFLMDPLESINIEKDTSFVLMLESFKRRHKVFFLPQGGIIKKEQQIYFHVTEIKPQDNKTSPFIKRKSLTLNQDEVDAVFIRTDPPFNEDYLLSTWLLDLLPQRIYILNRPSSIRDVNEKIWASQFFEMTPPTLIARDKTAINDFIAQYPSVIVKPVNGYGGQGVFKITKNDSNQNVIIETLSQNYTKEIIVQKYVKESQTGDKRVLLLEGNVLGAVQRVHSAYDHRNNFFSGGKAVKTSLTQRDLFIIKQLKPYLIKLGLDFVGIDIIGKYLIEINVTSPTCVQEINRIHKLKLEEDIINLVERKVADA